MADYENTNEVVTEEKAKKMPDLDGIAGAATLIAAGGVVVKGGELFWKKVLKPGAQKLAAKVNSKSDASAPTEVPDQESNEEVNAG